MMKVLTKIDIIAETVEYYKTHKRGLSDDGTCEYCTLEGDMCAVGRCLKPEYQNYNWSNEHHVDVYLLVDSGYDTEESDELRALLNHKYCHITDLDFWGSLQTLHDLNKYWIQDDDGGCLNKLSNIGEHYVAELYTKYAGT